jgi:predicted nucleotidyltransferase
MHEILESSLQRLGVDAVNLQNSAKKSKGFLDVAKETVARLLGEKYPESIGKFPVELVVFGSIARQESSEASDFDYGLIVYEMVRNPKMLQDIRVAAEDARQAVQLGKPGSSKIFGSLISSSEFVDRIGLDADTNKNHTNRMLLLQESVPLLRPDRHASLIAAVLDRYLADYENDAEKSNHHKHGVPRFLLNDVVRYWRTLAVDYQAKRWDEIDGEKWGMRYVKLRSTRKLGFVSALVSLYLPKVRDERVTTDVLQRQFALPSLARIAQLEEVITDPELRRELAKVFEAAEYFTGRFADKVFRDEVNEVRHPADALPHGAFAEAKLRTDELQRSLVALFTSKEPLGSHSPVSLGELTSKYLLF